MAQMPQHQHNAQLPADKELFRVKNKQSKQYLVAKAGQGGLTKIDHSADRAGSYWYIIEGEGKFDGYFRLINRDHPSCIILNSDGRFYGFGDLNSTGYSDQYWKMTDNKQSNHVIFSNSDGRFDHFDGTKYQKYDDQFWYFEFGAMDIISVSFDLKNAKIAKRTPMVIAEQTLENSSNTEQEFSFAFSKTVEHSSRFEISAGVTITVGAKMTAGVPDVADGEVSTELSAEMTLTYGTEDKQSQQYSATFPIKAKPNSVIKAQATVWKAEVDVPYTIKCRSKVDNSEHYSYGTWKGIRTWDLKYSVKNL